MEWIVTGLLFLRFSSFTMVPRRSAGFARLPSGGFYKLFLMVRQKFARLPSGGVTQKILMTSGIEPGIPYNSKQHIRTSEICMSKNDGTKC